MVTNVFGGGDGAGAGAGGLGSDRDEQYSRGPCASLMLCFSFCWMQNGHCTAGRGSKT